MTNVTSRGTARGRTAGGDNVISAKPSSFPGAFASSEIAALVERRIGIRSVTSPRASLTSTRRTDPR